MKGKIILALVALFAGGAIYLLLRDPVPPIFQWIQLRNPGWLSGSTPPSWLNYSVPDGLWAFAYALLISSIWSGSPTRTRIIWLLSIPLFVLGFEFTQLLGFIPGTFCPVDLAFCTAGLVLGIFVGDLKPKKAHHEKIFT